MALCYGSPSEGTQDACMSPGTQGTLEGCLQSTGAPGVCIGAGPKTRQGVQLVRPGQRPLPSILQRKRRLGIYLPFVHPEGQL